MDDDTTLGRVALDSLEDVQNFLSAAQTLKSLTLQLRQIQARRSRREHALARQIECITAILDDQAAESPRLRQFWQSARDELRDLDPPPVPCTPPAAPCKGGSS